MPQLDKELFVLILFFILLSFYIVYSNPYIDNIMLNIRSKINLLNFNKSIYIKKLYEKKYILNRIFKV